MAKFIDKKEQVYDLKLTSYGHYLFSIGTFKPTYYAFLDDNVIYDKQYAMARHANALLSQIYATGSELTNKTIILKDAGGTTHTMTFRNPAAPYSPQYMTGTTSTNIIVTNLTTSYDIVEQISRAVNSASSEGSIDITAGPPAGGLYLNADNGVQSQSLGGTASLGFTSTVYGTSGNGPGGCSGSGTQFFGAKPAASMSVFVGGFDPVIERQNEINKRIKDDTQYLESFVLFRDIESGSAAQQIVQDMSEDYDYTEARGEEGGGTRATSYFAGDLTSNMMIPQPDIFKFNGIIGDAHLDGESNAVPAWKIVTLQGLISSSAPEDTVNNQKIPQINIELNYTLDIESNVFEYNPDTLRETVDQTDVFADDQRVVLKSDDVMFYIEEVNTDILTENFEIEVFKVLTGSGPDVYDTLERKYFRKASNQIVNGFMRYAAPDISTQIPAGSAYAEVEGDESPSMFNSFRGVAIEGDLDTNSVEYYFDILMDHRVNQDIACKGAQDFNRSSYYVDIDFDCIEQDEELALYYDIYGTAVEPEICLD
jgi:hypothetical protein